MGLWIHLLPVVIVIHSLLHTVANLLYCNLHGFRHVHCSALRGLPQKGPHWPKNVGEQRNISWLVAASLQRVATSKSSLGAARHSLAFGVSLPILQNVNFTLLLTYLFPKWKTYVRALSFLSNRALSGFKCGPV